MYSRKEVLSYGSRRDRFNCIKLFHASIVFVLWHSAARGKSLHVHVAEVQYRVQCAAARFGKLIPFEREHSDVSAGSRGGIIPYEFRLSRKGLPCRPAHRDGTRRGSTSQPQSEINLDSECT